MKWYKLNQLKMKQNFISKFFYWLATVDPQTVSQCSKDEQKKILIFGLVMLIPILFGFEAGYYVTNLMSHGSVFLSICGAFTIAFLVMIIEKSVSSTIKSGKINGAVIGRFFFAIVWSMVLSFPVALAWFSDSINEQLATNRQAKVDKISHKYDAEINTLNKSLEGPANETEKARLIMVAEGDGTGGTGVPNLGPIYEMKKKQYEDRLAISRKAEFDVLSKIAEKEKAKDAEINVFNEEFATGYLGRVNALFDVMKLNPFVLFKVIITFLFLLCAEIIPIFIKLTGSSSNGAYIQLVEAQGKESVEVEKISYRSRIDIKLSEEANKQERRRLQLKEAAAKERADSELRIFKLKAKQILSMLSEKNSFERELLKKCNNDVELYKMIIEQFDKDIISSSTNENDYDISNTKPPFNYVGEILDDYSISEDPFSVNEGIVKTCKEVYSSLPANHTDADKAKAIFHWIENNIQYGKDKLDFDGQNNSIETFNAKQGVCSAMGCLFVSMANVLGIEESGFVFVQVDAFNKPVEHACAYFTDNNRTVLVDPSYHTYDITHQMFNKATFSEVQHYFQSVKMQKAA
jgi:hypothetical protein